jgi:hypothetical protein
MYVTVLKYKKCVLYENINFVSSTSSVKETFFEINKPRGVQSVNKNLNKFNVLNHNQIYKKEYRG